MLPTVLTPALIASALGAPGSAPADLGALLAASPVSVTSPLAGAALLRPTGEGGLKIAAPVDKPVGVVGRRVGSDQRRVLAYWTPQRMASAVPIDLLPIGGLLSGERRHQKAPASTSSGARWTGGGKVTKTTGRVFLTIDGVDSVCTAGAISSRNRDLVVTAGHCLKEAAGSWAENWTYVPAYEEGRTPYGTFTARELFVAKPWSDRGDDDYDLGMVALGKRRGKHLADVTGTQKIAFKSGRGGHAFTFGYPADAPFDGETLTYCGGKLRKDPHGLSGDHGLRCRMTAGSSGGPWLRNFNPDKGTGTVISVTSFKYSDSDEISYGPYFGRAAAELYARAQKA